MHAQTILQLAINGALQRDKLQKPQWRSKEVSLPSNRPSLAPSPNIHSQLLKIIWKDAFLLLGIPVLNPPAQQGGSATLLAKQLPLYLAMGTGHQPASIPFSSKHPPACTPLQRDRHEE
ncbi:hypothetical protein AAES_109225 [Amazona aestiva]|uniref:Uncharacterized protein n=1 Tax=Amazona aestiva TaxID=12930 RepID=A0A0Q3MGV8_AMAAE|nr:hypothetical protein AAES_109225 [Amazona aestiva]